MFTRDELAEAFAKFEQTVARAAETRDWDPWVEQYSPDVVYVEHAAGTMRGREEVRAWIWKTMETFPGSYMTAFPSLWTVIDEPTGRVICELDNPMRDPGDGTIISATNISIVTYARRRTVVPSGGHLQPAAVRVGDGEVVPQGRRTRDPARRGRRVDDEVRRGREEHEGRRGREEHESRRCSMTVLVIGANGFLGSHVTRQLVATGRTCG